MSNIPHVCSNTAKPTPHLAVIGCIETLNQGILFLDALNDDDFTAVAHPHITSSIGEHYRHWLDLFHAIRLDNTKIDYNIRRRGHKVERNIAIAKQEINLLIDWLYSLAPSELHQSVQVETEVLLSQTHVEEVSSTLVRELTFAALHATHHYAMAKAIASLIGIASDKYFGVAPTTASFQRATQ